MDGDVGHGLVLPFTAVLAGDSGEWLWVTIGTPGPDSP
jgi:hypothetical protein